MDTESMMMNNGGLVFETFAELSPEELEAVRRHVELARHLQEIRSLYQVFRFDLESLTNSYTLMNSGVVLRGGEPALSERDYIALNAHTNNIISAAQTLLKSMECYIEEHYPKEATERVAYMTHYHGVYDGSFAYRLLIRLRDYAQHGHLPVSREGEHYCVNLYHILHRPHFTHNPAIKQQLTDAAEEIMKVYGDTPTVSLTMTLAEFTAQFLSVYEKFWDCVAAELKVSDEKYRAALENNPQNMLRPAPDAPEFFVFEIGEDNMAHTVCPGDDTLEMLRNYAEEAAAAHHEYKAAWEDLRGSMLTIHVSEDRQRIELGGM